MYYTVPNTTLGVAMHVIYADVVWFINLAMDCVLLVIAGWMAKRPVRWRRIISGGAMGACYSMILFVPVLSPLTTWPGKVVMSMLMVLVAIPVRTLLEYLRVCSLFYFAAFVLAGAALALHFAIPGATLAGGTMALANGVNFVGQLGVFALMIAVPVGVVVIYSAIGWSRRKQNEAGVLYRVRVNFFEKSVEFIGLADTGNRLRDPVSRRPVCLVEARVIAQLLPEDMGQGLVSAPSLSNWLLGLEDNYSRRMTVIPYRSAGGREQWTVALRPDAVTIEQGDHWQQAPPCLLAIQQNPLSVEGEFKAILHTDLLMGDDSLENHSNPPGNQHSVAHTAAPTLDSSSHESGRRCR
ncbi:hypothetical protein D2Q93_03095 [Alicyclobacillaceae bacterium I2511]|nr:hypothetical protein D2Q93_03095 [Alicyclobacillaceae bacterium I2511]